MSERVKFTPIRGIEDTILSMPFVNGQIYFATDTGKIYLDCYDSDHIQKNKLSVGGGGVSLVYGYDSSPIPTPEQEGEVYFTLQLETLENNVSVNDLILNVDGCFYKVLSIEDSNVNCLRLAVSGSGGGSSQIEPDVAFDFGFYSYDFMSFIYGQESFIQFTPKAERDSRITLKFEVFNNENETIFEKVFTGVFANKLYQFNMGQLPMGTNLNMAITLSSQNSVSHPLGLVKRISGINIVQLGVHKDSSFSSTTIQTSAVTVNYFIDGGEGFDLKVYPSIDGELATNLIASVQPGTTARNVRIPAQSHGVHTIGIKVGTTVASGIVYSDEIFYEIAWKDENDSTPLIWIKDMPTTIVQYENCIINYMVYDPAKALTGSKTEVNLLDTLMNEEISTVYPQYSNSSNNWLTWDLTENYHVGNNIFTIQCGIASKDISFQVTTEGSRDLGLVDAGILRLNLSSTGRSNEESLTKRTSWTYTDIENNEYTTTFNNFNWYNNGWKDDKDGQGSYLSVANGSSATINFRTLPFNTSNMSYTIELRFRIRNVQEYSTLVTTEPFYYVVDDNGVQQPEPQSINVIKAQGLKVAVDEDGNWIMDRKKSITKAEFEKGVCFKFWDPNEKWGLFVGTQEAYFKAPSSTVNVRYKEDDIINLTFTIGFQDLISVYLNGILSGAVEVGEQTFRPATTQFEINSKYCDIDIYKLRVYENNGKPLTMSQVIHNYLSDEHNLTLYDQNQLTKNEDPTALSYKKVVAYNQARLNELQEEILQGHNLNEDAYNVLTMPYATIEIIDNTTAMKDPTKTQRRTDDDRLPYAKGGKRYCEINFVNPVADALLDAGKITEEEYYTHCPSYKVIGCEIDVQGTSSQGYPRRNFKTKMKSATNGKDAEKIPHDDWGWFYTKGSKAGKKFKKWNMDNAYYTTNKFTWKIDYMESSGTYNTGFANLMGNMYNYHPLANYNFDGVSPIGLRTTVYGFPTLVFQKHSTPSDKAKIGTTYEDEIYEYIGRYNINLDKGSNELYGFEAEGEQKYITLPLEEQWDEEIDNGDGTTSTIHHTHPLIADVAECWELTDNQGTWTSFSYPSDINQESPFNTYTADSYVNGVLINDPKLEVIRHFECRYNKYGDFIEAIADDEKPYDIEGVLDKINDPDTKAADKAIWESINTIPKMNRFIVDKWHNLESLVTWLDSTDTRKANPNLDIGQVTYEVTSEPSDMTGATSEIVNDIIYVTFTKDTAAYRLEKFRNEFSKHLNLNYCAIYYILTELLLCYDSRGKNMMLASWGPQEVGGDYIWYPIFYDIDTQLGLNNIGATLWDYDTDASATGTFSTPSSVLWVNFANAFEEFIINTYKTLRLNKLKEENIEGAYLCSPEVFDSYAMRGVRPLVAIGLDEYVKYLKPAVNGYLSTTGDVKTDKYGYVYAINGDRKLSRELLIRNRLNYLDSYWKAGIYDTSEGAGDDTCVLLRCNANASLNTSDIFLDSNLLDSIPVNAGPDTVLAPYNTGNTVGLDAVPQFTITPFLYQYVFTYIDKTPQGKPVKFQGTPVETTVSTSALEGFKITPSLSQQITRIPGPDYISSLGDLSTKYFDEFKIKMGKRLIDLILGSDIEGYFNNRNMTAFELNGAMYETNGSLNENRKTLLQKVVLTNMGELGGPQSYGGQTIDLSGSEKLQEFRALGTQVQNVKFAKGAPLTTVHLPKSVNNISLIESKNLTRLLVSKPLIRHTIAEGSEYYPHESYEGLYLENITDIDNSNVTLTKVNNRLQWNNVENIYHAIKLEGQTDADVKPNMIDLQIIGGNLKYESYKLLLKAIAVKENAASSGVRLKIDYEDINWCPYTKLGIYDIYDSNNANKYYVATDHNTFEQFNQINHNWNQLLKNGKIYYYEQSQDENIIDSLDLLDFFIQDYEEGLNSPTGINHYTDIDSLSAHWPRLTGIMYINNSELNPIQEDKLTSTYAQKWPDLTIFAAHVSPSNIVKCVQIGSDGRENELEITRLPTTQDNPVVPNVLPSKGTHYDFIGWSTDIEGEHMFFNYDFINNVYTNASEAIASYSFNTDGNTLVLYAQFQVHNQKVQFVYPDGITLDLSIPYNSIISIPDKMPYLDDSSLGTYETYQFLGWNYTDSIDDPNSVISLSTFKITKDYLVANNEAMHTVWRHYTYSDNVSPDLIGQLKPVSVYDNIHPEWFTVTNTSYSFNGTNGRETGYEIQLTKPAIGKLTIPAYINNQPVIAIRSSSTNDNNINYLDPALSNITHIFIQRNSNELVNLRVVRDRFFLSTASGEGKLRYFDLNAPGLERIEDRAFYQARNFSEMSIIGGTLVGIGEASFVSCFSNRNNPENSINLTIDGNIINLGNSAFGNMATVADGTMSVQIGNQNNKTSLIYFNRILEGNTAKISSIMIYHNNTEALQNAATLAECSSVKEYLVKQLFGENVNYDIAKITISQ